MNRPPCYDPPSASTAIPRTPGIDFEHSTDNNTQNQTKKRKGRNDSESDAGADIARNASTDEDFARWKCESCKLVSPCGTKPCGCRAKRRRLCAIPDCMRQSAGSGYDQYCMRHYRHRTSNVSEETPSLNSRQRGHHEKKNSCANLERQERAEGNSEDTPQWKWRGCGKTHSSERKRCPPPCRRWKDGRRTWDCQNDAISKQSPLRSSSRIMLMRTKFSAEGRIPMLIESAVILLANGLVIAAVPATLAWWTTAASVEIASISHVLGEFDTQAKLRESAALLQPSFGV